MRARKTLALKTFRARSFAALRMIADGLRLTALEKVCASSSRVANDGSEFRPKTQRVEGERTSD
jgi:hypothetical protein